MLTPELLYGLGALVLLAVLLWAFTYVRGRNRANDQITEDATREQYEHPQAYERERERLNKEIRPS